MFERLAKNKREFEEQTKVHINEYADAGLRTLILAYRELDEEEYNEFNAKFTEAKNAVSADRDQRVEQVTEKIEKDLILLGATAVEDKLQNGVPECIDKLAQAGIKIMRRIEAEELSLGASEIVITSSRQEIEQQWRLYDGFDPILERKLQAKIKRNVSCYGRFMPRMALIPPGMEFHNIVPQDGDMDAETEGNEDHSSSPDPLIWTEGVFINPAFIEAFGLTINDMLFLLQEHCIRLHYLLLWGVCILLRPIRIQRLVSIIL